MIRVMNASSATANLTLQRISGNLGEARCAANNMTTLNNVTISSAGTPVAIKGITQSDVADNLQLTATLTTGQQDTEAFSVIAAEITAPIVGGTVEVERAQPTVISARLLPSGLPYHHVEWEFTGGQGGIRNTGTDPSTTITMVDGMNVYTVRVRFYEDTLSILCSAELLLSVTARTGPMWTTPHTVVEDNDPNFGSLPTLAASQTPPGVLYGQLRDRVTDNPIVIRPNPFGPGLENYTDGFTMVRVNDPSGPNHQYWYIETATFYVDMETVINRYIKQAGPPPSPGQPNFYNYNNGRCINSADFVRAVMGHENSGVNPSATGHYGLIVDALNNTIYSPRRRIEDNFATHTQGKMVLENMTTDELANTDSYLVVIISAESNVTGNWSASDKWAVWDTSRSKYSGCIIGRDF